MDSVYAACGDRRDAAREGMLTVGFIVFYGILAAVFVIGGLIALLAHDYVGRL